MFAVKKSFSKLLCGALALGMSGLFLTCTDNVGLGESVDTQAPTIEISYPPASAIIRGTFTFAGTWKDDKGVSSVTASIMNTATKQTYPANEVKLGLNSWSVEVNNYSTENSDYINGWQLPDGKYEVSVYAMDKSGHKSGTASRTFEIDNTAPVMVLESPGSTTTATKYGSSFSVSGTIADEHTVASLSVTLYDEDGNPLDETDIEPYTETSVPTAGGTSISLLSFSSDPKTTQQQRYQTIYGNDKDAGTKPYSCVVNVADNAKEYVTPDETENNSTGNATSTFYLYNDVYKPLMSSNSYGLSAADLMTIINGTYVAYDETARSAGVVVGVLSREQLATVKDMLTGENSVAVNTVDKHLQFSLNPAVNPTYTVSGLMLEDMPKGTRNQTITFIVSPGLDGTLIEPNSIKVWLLDCGKLSKDDEGRPIFDRDKYAAFIQNPTAFEGAEGVIKVADLSDGDSTPLQSVTSSFQLPRLVANDYYVIAVSGQDADGNTFRSDGEFGFVGALSGTPPQVNFTEPRNQSIVSDSDKVVFKGTAVTTELELAKLKISIDVSNAENGESVGSFEATGTGASGDAVTWGKPKANEDGTEFSYEWEFKLSAAEEYEKYSAKTGSERIYMYSAKATATDASNNSSYASRAVTVDTVPPVVTIVSVVPSVSGYTDATHTDEKETYVNGTVTISGTITEMNLKSASYTVYVGEGDAAQAVETGELKNTAQFKIPIDTTKYDDDKPINVVVTAEDRANTELATSLDDTQGKGNIGSDSTTALLSREKEKTPQVSYHILQKTDYPVINPTNSDFSITSLAGIKKAVKDNAANKNIFEKKGRIQALVTDDDGVKEIKAWYRPLGANGEFATEGEYTAITALSYSASNNMLSVYLPDAYGDFEIKIEVTDTVGNPVTGKTTASIAVAVDDGAPSFKSVEPVDNAFFAEKLNSKGIVSDVSGAVTLKLTSAEDQGKDSIYGTEKSLVQDEKTPTDFPFDDTISVPKESHTYTLEYTATDKYGQATAYPITYIVDSEKPEIEKPEIKNATTTNGYLTTNTPTITVKARDNEYGSGIATVKATVGSSTEGFPLAANGSADTVTRFTTYEGVVTLNEGENVVTVTVADRAGNENTNQTEVIKVDTRAPSITLPDFDPKISAARKAKIVEDDGGLILKPTVIDTGSGVVGVWLDKTNEIAKAKTLDDAAIKVKLETADKSETGYQANLLVPVSELTDGTHVYYVWAIDNAGKTAVSSVPISFTVDTVAPSINVANVLKSDAVYTENDVSNKDDTVSPRTGKYAVSGTWQDMYAGTSKLFYSTNKGADWAEINVEQAAGVTLPWNEDITVEEGFGKSIWFKALDSYGNETLPADYKKFDNITFDFSAPVIKLTTTSAAQTKDAVTIAGTAEDVLALTKEKIVITVKKDSEVQTGIVPQITQTTAGKDKPYAFTLTIPAKADHTNDGLWTVTIDAKDDAGRAAAQQSVTVTIDTTAPTIGTPALDANNATTQDGIYYFNGALLPNISVTASDSGVGIKTVKYGLISGEKTSADGITEWKTVLSENETTYSVKVTDFSTLGDGKYTIFIQATDVVGNTSYSVPYKVCNDKTAPTLTKTDNVGSFTTTDSQNKFELFGTVSDENFAEIKLVSSASNSTDTAASTIPTTGDTKTNATWKITQSVTDDTASHVFTFAVTATDYAGNTATIPERKVTIDRTAPTFPQDITLENAPTFFTNNQNCTFTGKVQDETDGSGLKSVKAIYYSASETEPGDGADGYAEVSVSSDGSFSHTFYAVPQGKYIFKIIATDAAGNTGKPSSFPEFTVDTIAPNSTVAVGNGTLKTKNESTHTATDATSIAWGTETTYITGGTFTLTGDVTDNYDFDESGVTLTVNNVTESLTKTTTGTGANAKTTWTYNQLATDGTYTYRLTVKDKAGNTDTKTLMVLVDTKAPAVTVTSPTANTNYSDGTVTLEGTALDGSGSGAKSVFYTLVKVPKTGAETTVTEDTEVFVTDNQWSLKGENKLSLKGENAGESQYKLTVKAKDYLDNTSAAAAPVVFYYDKTAPVVSGVTLTGTKENGLDYYSSGSFTLTAIATDVVSNVASVMYTVDKTAANGGVKKAMGETSTAGTYEASVVLNGDGEHTVYVYAKDERGNETENPVSATVKVDTSAPTFSEISGASKAKVDVTISGKLTENIGLLESDGFVITAVKTSGGTETNYNASQLTGTNGILSSVTKPDANKPLSADTPLPSGTSDGSWSFTLPALGNHTNDGKWKFTITAKDVAGNADSVTREVIIDTTNPEISSSATDIKTEQKFTEDGKDVYYFNSSSSFGLTVSATDATAGLATVEYAILSGHTDTYDTENNSSVLDWTKTIENTDANNWQATVKGLIGKPDGAYTVFIRATDNVGNYSAISSIRLLADTVDPTLTETDGVEEYTTASTGSFELSGTVSDTNFLKLELTESKAIETGDTAIATGTITPTNDTWRLTQTVTGSGSHGYHYTLTATDKAGNHATITKKVSIDNDPPVVAISTLNTKTYVADTKINTANCSFVGTVTDALSGKSTMAGYLFEKDYIANSNQDDVKNVLEKLLKNDGDISSLTDAEKTIAAEIKTSNAIALGSTDKWDTTLIAPKDGYYTPIFVASDKARNIQVMIGDSFATDFAAPTSTLKLTANAVRKIDTEKKSYTVLDGGDKNYGDGATAEDNLWNKGITYYAKDTFTLSGTISDTFGFTPSKLALKSISEGVTTPLSVTTFSDNSSVTSVDWTYNQNKPASDTAYTYQLELVDDAGNSTTKQFIVRFDTTQPTVSIVSPTAGSLHNDEKIALEGTVVDAGSGVKSVSYEISNVAGKKVSGNVAPTDISNGRWTVAEAAITGTGVTADDMQGVLTVTAYAADYLDNENAAGSVSFYRDSVKPTVSDAVVTTAKHAEADDGWYNTSVLSLSAKAQDGQSGLAGVTYQVFDENSQGGSVTAMKLSSGGDTVQRDATADSVVLSEGLNTIKIIATDKVANPSGDTDLTVHVDTTKPAFGATKVYKTDDANKTSINLTNAAFTIAGTLTEQNLAGTNPLTITAKKGDVTKNISVTTLPTSSASATPWNANVTVNDITDGEWTFTITAKDKAGNSESTTVTVQIDTTRPEVRDYAENQQIIVDGKNINTTWYKANTLTVRGAFSEAGSGVSKVFYYVKTPDETEAVPNNLFKTDSSGAFEAIDGGGMVTLADVTNGSDGKVYYTATPSNFKANAGTTANEVYVQAMDKAGNYSDRRGPYNVNVDQKEPDASSKFYTFDAEGVGKTPNYASASGTLYTNGKNDMTVYGTVNDTASGIASLSFELRGKMFEETGANKNITITYSTGTVTESSTAADFAGLTYEPYDSAKAPDYKAWKASITGSELDSGNVRMKAEDTAGNSTSQQIFALVVDKTSPELNVSGAYTSKLVAKSVKEDGTDIKELSETDKDKDNAVLSINGTATFAGTATDNYTLTSVDMYYSTDHSAEIKTGDTKVDLTSGSNAFSWKFMPEVSSLDSATGKVTVLGENSTDAASKTLYAKFVAKDSAGNESIYVYEYLVDPLSDKPTINISNIAGNGGTLKYETTITGTVKDDDDIDLSKCELRVYEFTGTESAPASVSAWESSGTKVNLTQTGEWTYTLNKETVEGKEIIRDGEKKLYLYFKDVAGTSFWTSYDKGVKTAFQPNVTFKTKVDGDYSPDNNIVFRVDSESPAVTDATALSFKTNGDNAVANEASDTGVVTSFVVGGTMKKYARFKMTATDANGIAGMTYKLTGKDKTGNDLILTYATANKIAGIENNYTVDNTNFTTTGTSATWVTGKIDFSQFATGQLSLAVTAYDNSQLLGNGSYYFSVDNSGPSIKINSPRAGEEKTGTVTMQGMALDEGDAGTVDIAYFVPTVTERTVTWTTDEALAGATKKITVGGKEMDVSVWNRTLANEDGVTATNWKFIFDEKNEDTYLNQYDDAKYCGENIADGVYTIPMYLMATDELGNYTIMKDYTIKYNPDGDKPVTTFSYPAKKDYDDYDKDTGTSSGYITLGGTIRLTGSTEIPSRTSTVDSIYYQVDQSSTFASDYISSIKKGGTAVYKVCKAYEVLNSMLGKNFTADTEFTDQQLADYGFASNEEAKSWWGIKATGSAAWSIVLNTDGELNPAEAVTNNIYVRACGVNANGKFGAWTSGDDGVIQVHIDSNLPTVDVAINQYKSDITLNSVSSATAEASQVYKTDMFLRGQWYLVATASDESGINKLNVKKGNSDLSAEEYKEEKIDDNTYKVFIKIDTEASGTLEYTISAMDKDNKTATQKFSFSIDNTAPTLENLAGNGEAVAVIKDSGYVYTLSGQSSDAGSGVERIVFYYMRKNTGDTPITKQIILDPMITTTGSDYEAAKITMPSSFTNVADGDIDLLNIAQGNTTYELYAYKVAGASSTIETFAPTAVTLNAHVRVGGLIYIDGMYRRISKIESNTVSFEPSLSEAKDSVTAWFPIAQVIDNSATEQVENYKTFEFKKGDDGDGMPESFSRKNGVWIWDALIHSNNMPDGPVSLVILAFDTAGNVNGTTINTSISNNAPRLAKLYLATDLNDNAQFEDNEFETYNILEKETSLKENYILTLSDYVGFIAKNKLAVVPELVGGNGNVLLVAKKDAEATTNEQTGKQMAVVVKKPAEGSTDKTVTAIKSIASGSATAADDGTVSVTIGKSAKDTESAYSITAKNFVPAQAGNNFFAYVLDNATLTGIAAFDTNANTSEGRDANEKADSAKDETTGKLKADKSFSFTFWDSTDETTQGTSSQKAVVLVNGFTFDLTDGTSPTTVINPFYWNDVETNSVYGSGKNKKADDLQGHIELEKDLTAEIKDATAGDTTLGDDPKVSGKIVFTGTAYDEHSLASLAFTFVAGDAEPTYSNGTWTGGTVMATYYKDGLANDTTKTPTWEDSTATIGSQGYEVTTSPTGENGVYKDKAYFNQDGHKVYWTLAIDTAKLLSDVADKDVKLTVYAADLSGNVTASEIVQPTFDDAENYKAGTNEGRTVTDGKTNVPVYQMDVVPYITKVYTSLAALKKNNWSVYNRTALGHYPVASNDTVYLYGFNLGSSGNRPTYGTTSLDEPVAGSTTKINGTATTYPSGDDYAAYQVVTFPVSNMSTSGKVTLTVNKVPMLNNVNDKNSKGAYTGTTLSATGDVDVYANYYNRQPNGDNNNLLTDDVWFDVWEFDPQAVKPKVGSIEHPVMAISPKDKNIGFAFVGGTAYFSMPYGTNSKSVTPNSFEYWIGGLDAWNSVSLAYDINGYSYGTAAGGDLNTSKHGVDTFRFTTSRWNGKGTLETTGYTDLNNQFGLEFIGEREYFIDETGAWEEFTNFSKERIKSPCMSTVATTTDTSQTTLYLAYYDAINDEIRFDWGVIKNTKDTSDDVGMLKTSYEASSRKSQPYSIANTSLIAGQTINKPTSMTPTYASSPVTTTKGDAVYGGEYVSIAALPNQGTSDDAVVAVWWDGTHHKMLYSYNKTPKSIAKGKYKQGDTKWSPPEELFPQEVGEYCKVAVDADNGVHIAAYDGTNGDLWYAYLSAYDSPSTAKAGCLDSNGFVGSELNIDVAMVDGNPVPYISYYASNAAKPKMAKWVGESLKTTASVVGAEYDACTSNWETTYIPTSSKLTLDHINIGVWKTDAGVLTSSKTGTKIFESEAGSNKNSYGTVWGNGTTNAVLGYATKSGSLGYIETAQMK